MKSYTLFFLFAAASTILAAPPEFLFRCNHAHALHESMRECGDASQGYVLERNPAYDAFKEQLRLAEEHRKIEEQRQIQEQRQTHQAVSNQLAELGSKHALQRQTGEMGRVPEPAVTTGRGKPYGDNGSTYQTNPTTAGGYGGNRNGTSGVVTSGRRLGTGEMGRVPEPAVTTGRGNPYGDNGSTYQTNPTTAGEYGGNRNGTSGGQTVGSGTNTGSVSGGGSSGYGSGGRGYLGTGAGSGSGGSRGQTTGNIMSTGTTVTSGSNAGKGNVQGTASDSGHNTGSATSGAGRAGVTGNVAPNPESGGTSEADDGGADGPGRGARPAR